MGEGVYIYIYARVLWGTRGMQVRLRGKSGGKKGEAPQKLGRSKTKNLTNCATASLETLTRRRASRAQVRVFDLSV